MRPGYGKSIVCLTLGLVLVYWAFVRQDPVPGLSLADLALHEVGHVLWSVGGETAMFLGGNATQSLIPVLLALVLLLRHRDLAGAGLCTVWAATTLQNASVYIADGPTEALPLIGGEHDWAYLLGQWNALDQAQAIARVVFSAGVLVAILGLALMLASAWRVRRLRQGSEPWQWAVHHRGRR